MVRIVNGEIVPDNVPVRNEPVVNDQSKNIFPETYGIFGSLSNTVSFLGYKSEIIWLIILFGAGWLYGGKWLIILSILLLVYKRNHNSYLSRQPKFSSFSSTR